MNLLAGAVLYACTCGGLVFTVLGLLEWANRRGPQPTTIAAWALCVAYPIAYLFLK